MEKKSQNAVIGLLFVGVLMGALDISIVVLNSTSAEDRATSQGMLTIFTSIGQITGTAVIGMLMASMTTGVFATVFKGVAILLACMMVLSLWLEGKGPVTAAHEGVGAG